MQHQRGISKLTMCPDCMLQRAQAWCGHCLVFWLGLSCGPFWSTSYIVGCFICSHQQHRHFSLHSTSWCMVYITRYMTCYITWRCDNSLWSNKINALCGDHTHSLCDLLSVTKLCVKFSSNLVQEFFTIGDLKFCIVSRFFIWLG